jgi:hypothetical protein
MHSGLRVYLASIQFDNVSASSTAMCCRNLRRAARSHQNLLWDFLRVVGNHQPIIPMFFEDVGHDGRAVGDRRAVLQSACAPDFFLAKRPSAISVDMHVRVHGRERDLRQIGKAPGQ